MKRLKNIFKFSIFIVILITSIKIYHTYFYYTVKLLTTHPMEFKMLSFILVTFFSGVIGATIGLLLGKIVNKIIEDGIIQGKW